MSTLEVIGPPGHFYECPRWHDGRWWVSDFFDHRVVTVNTDGATSVVAVVEGQPAGLGWLPDGSLLIVSMLDRRILRHDGIELSEYADLRALFPGNANDMMVDAGGRAYVGNFGFDLTDPGSLTTPTCLAVVTADRDVRVAAEDLRFPNAIMLAKSGSELIVNETFASRHTAFTVDADGGLSDRRVWAQPFPEPPDPDHALDGLRYAPDGGCIDAGGGIWAADASGDSVLHVLEGGRIDDRVRVPDGLHPFACALGGPTGTTLLVAAAPDFGAQGRSASRDSVLLQTTVATPAPT